MDLVRALCVAPGSLDEVVHCWTEAAVRLAEGYTNLIGNYPWFRRILQQFTAYPLVVRTWYGFIPDEPPQYSPWVYRFLSYCHNMDCTLQDVPAVDSGLARLLRTLIPPLPTAGDISAYSDLYPIALFQEYTGLSLEWAQFLLAKVRRYGELRARYPQWFLPAFLLEAEIVATRDPILESYFTSHRVHCTRLALALGRTLSKLLHRYFSLDLWCTCHSRADLDALLQEPLFLLLVHTAERTPEVKTFPTIISLL